MIISSGAAIAPPANVQGQGKGPSVGAIATGRFSGVKQAEQAVEKLRNSCGPADRVRTMVLMPGTQTAKSASKKPSIFKHNHGAEAFQASARTGIPSQFLPCNIRRTARG